MNHRLGSTQSARRQVECAKVCANRAMGTLSEARRMARKCRSYRRLGKAGDRSRTGDIQLGKLTFYH